MAADPALAVTCYERAYDIARQPAPIPKDPFAPDPQPARRSKWWPTEVRCRAAICNGEAAVAVTQDVTIAAAGTVAKVAAELARLRSIGEEVAAKVIDDESHSWLLYNVSVRVYTVLEDALYRGMEGPALTMLLPPLLWSAAAIDACASLCAAAYVPWRVQVCTLICRSFDSIGKPSTALQFCKRLEERLTVRARPGRLSALSVPHSKSGFYGAFVWAHRALNGPFRRFAARAGL